MCEWDGGVVAGRNGQCGARADISVDFVTVGNAPDTRYETPGYGSVDYVYQNGYTIDSPYYSTEVGEFENSESPYGTFDQGGNVFEWNETAVTASSRGLRGGDWDGHSDNLLASNRNNNPTNENNNIGFRVASS